MQKHGHDVFTIDNDKSLEPDLLQNIFFIEKGDFMLSYQEELIKRIIEESSVLVDFGGHEVFVVNAPHEFASRIGYMLYTKKPPLAVTWYQGKDGVHVSLRSDGSVDVGKLAEKYGGGGHKTASGFSLPSVTSFPWREKSKSKITNNKSQIISKSQ